MTFLWTVCNWFERIACWLYLWSSPRMGSSRLATVPALLWPLQENMARLVLDRLDVPRLPGRLTVLLRRHDVRHAWHTFARQMGVSAAILLDSTHWLHTLMRARFSEALNLLFEIEHEEEKSGLSAAALYVLLAGPLDTAWSRFRRYQHAAALYGVIETTAVPFPLFAEFREEARRLLDGWPEIDEDVLTNLHTIREECVVLNEIFQNAITELNALLAWLAALGPGPLGEFGPAIAAMASEKESLDEDILRGAVPPDDGVRALIDLLEKLRVVAAHLGYGDESEEASPVEGEPDRLERYLAVLGLSPGATARQVKSRYRKLVKHCHPDTCSDHGAAARFRELTEAYDWLMHYFKSKE